MKYEKAIRYIQKAHWDQKRDWGGPYLSHLLQVQKILSIVTDDEDIIVAWLLHDTIEDTECTYSDIEREFGTRVADLVNEVTHEGKKDSHWYYFPRLESKEGIMIKFADRLSNISDMDAWDEKRQKHFLKKSKFWKEN